MTTESRVSNRDLGEWVYSDQSTIHGTGLFARKRIDKGTYIGTYHGPLAKRNGTYVLWLVEPDEEGNLIGRSGRNLLRFLNHSDPGNAEFDGFDLYALTDIEQDEEITFNYEPE
ncbi:MAG: SET domain-containing protein-lysine N-methyltransferase [Sedimenticola sp.]|nr:SET domain-containing protein-lysine N-methyltransferase [Sedimenticola sp.]